MIKHKINQGIQMPKNIVTRRNELVCGKLDSAETIAVSLENIELIDLLHDIRFDCERMEQICFQCSILTTSGKQFNGLLD